MKKRKIAVLIGLFACALLALGLAACGHQHTYGAGWTYDATHHWHEATCEHTGEKDGYAEHTWNDGTVTTAATCETAGVMTYTCTVCSATKTEPIPATGNHAWDNGIVTTPAGCLTDGTTKFTCTVCGATKEEPIPATGHTFSEEWTADVTHHWHAATCEHTDEKKDYAEHTFQNEICTVCGDQYGSKGLKYTLSGDSTYYSVMDIGTCTDTVIYIPSTYNGKPVKEIGESAFYQNTTITGVVLPDSITTIGRQAFQGCNNLESITIPGSVTNMGDHAFRECILLKKVTISNGMTSIGHFAFYGCSSLTSVTLGNGMTSIGDYAFQGCSSLTSVTIPNSVTSIGFAAFLLCSSLESVTIGSGVTGIGRYAFEDCNNLTSVTFANPYGWSAYASTSSTNISSSDLENTSTAATYLTSTYFDCYWRRTA